MTPGGTTRRSKRRDDGEEWKIRRYKTSELTERLELIESMIAEGRRSTTRWAWTIVLWGVAFYVAIAWSSGFLGGPIWGQHIMAWPVTMIGTWLLSWGLATRMAKSANAPMTTMKRAIISIWTAMGISMFALLLPLGLSGRADQQVCVAVIVALLGMANAASGILLKWKAQIVMRGSVVAGWGGVTIRHRYRKHGRVPGCDFLLPDCVRNLRDDPASRAGGGRGLQMPELPELNPVIHGKLRLALLSLLMGVEEAEFTWLREKTGSTDGNLGAQLMKLEEAEYVAVEKKFVLRKPQTLYRMTEKGRAALSEYVNALRQLLGNGVVSS